MKEQANEQETHLIFTDRSILSDPDIFISIKTKQRSTLPTSFGDDEIVKGVMLQK